MTFQDDVLAVVKKIPPGNVTTYKEIAKVLGTKAFRAVGTAVGKNPDAPRVPCHRVVNSDGRVGKYSGAGGVQAKIALLGKEGVLIMNGKVDLNKYGIIF